MEINNTSCNFIVAGYLARNKFTVMRDTAAAIVIQKYLRCWFFRHAYMQLRLASVLLQSSIRGFSTRRVFLCRKEERAATLIQVNIFFFNILISNCSSVMILWSQSLWLCLVRFSKFLNLLIFVTQCLVQDKCLWTVDYFLSGTVIKDVC